MANSGDNKMQSDLISPCAVRCSSFQSNVYLLKSMVHWMDQTETFLLLIALGLLHLQNPQREIDQTSPFYFLL